MCGWSSRAVILISARNRSDAEHRAELGAEHLERDLAVVLEVAGEVDGGHAARAELALDDVPIIECCGNQRGFVAHAGKVRRVSRERQSAVTFRGWA